MYRSTFLVTNGRPRTNNPSIPMLIVTVILCGIVAVPPTLGAAVGVGGHGTNHRRHERRHALSPRQASQRGIDPMDYLMKFGYLPKGDLETGALRSKEEIERAVKVFQRFARLNVTGELDGSTLHQMSKPRCGNTDIITNDPFPLGRTKRFVIASSRWKKSHLTFRILNYTPDMTQAEIRDSIIRAFDVWSRVTNMAFYEKTTGPADIMIRFTRQYHHDGYPFDGKGSVLAHAFYPGDERGGDIHFDDDELWAYKGDKGVNLFSVATHEIGHTLGLAHSQVPPALMYPWYSGTEESIKLHNDDIVAIQFLYGDKNHSMKPEVTPAYTFIPGTRNPSPKPTIEFRTHKAATKQPPSLPSEATHTTKAPRFNTGPPPNPCSQLLRIDAIATLRREIFVFSNLWFWRVSRDGERVSTPYFIHRFWTGLPDFMTRVDAVYETHNDHIIFFVGKKFFEMTNNHLSKGFPKEGKSLTDLGLPNDIDHVDAAFRWSYNGMTFVIAGDMYWKYNEAHMKMHRDYPRDMSMWSGVPIPVDAAFAYKGKTYFFKDDKVWQFNDIRMSVKKSHYPKLWTEKIFNCESNSINLMGKDMDHQDSSNKTPLSDAVHDENNSASIRTLPKHHVIMVVFFMQFSFSTIKLSA